MEQTKSNLLSFSLEEESGALHACFDPAGGPAPDVESLTQALKDRGWGEYYLDRSSIDAFLAACGKAAQAVDMVIGARRDGEFALHVDSDLMTAWFTLMPPQGGKAVTMEALEQALRAEGIVHGIDRSAIESAFAAGQCGRAAIAHGTPAVEGTPTCFEILFDREDKRAEADDYDGVSYDDLSHILVVKSGDRLMRRVPPVPGKNGTNIKGHALLPKPVADIPFATGLQGAAPDPNDPNLLLATVGGQPSRRGNGVIVNSVIDVKSVDRSTGNIRLEGTLRVGGDVKAGMQIHATGDVVVNGTVEAAHITAGGNVAIRGGVVGHVDKRPGAHALPETTARVVCDGSVQALFMEAAHVQAGKSIMVTRSTRQCELVAREEIIVGKPGTKTGQVIGGRSQATSRVAAGVLGASMGVKTYIQVGIDPYLEQQIAEVERQLQKKYDEIDNVVKLLAYFKQNPKKGEGGIAEKVETTRKQVMASIDTLTEEMKALREQLGLAEQAEVQVGATIHFGVEVHIARQSWQAPDDMSGGIIRLVGGRIALGKEE